MRDYTPERWQQVSAVLDEALELPAPDRAAFLDRACAADPSLRPEVDALLAAEAASSGFLEDPVGSYLAAPGPEGDPPAEADECPPGTVLGPYRILHEIARGGMGAVYLAERADGQYEQRVALKLVRAGLDHGELRRRFLAERQILARLDHPRIARLVDGGIAPDGRPWLAMEYIDGRSLTQFSDAHRLGIGDRLRLFAAVCEAVRYAHQNLIVHRDLKPANILVTADGTVKLLDFGIAKLLDTNPDGTEADTRTELRVLTPEYAAPEQIRGDPITTATDVYALGAVLYELLAGRRAHRFERPTPAEIERVVCETEPERPSAVSSLPVEADLDAVVLKALEKEPARRYHSVEALLDDVRRFLDGLPVQARAPTLGHRARKFIRRHRVGVGAAAAVILALAGGLGVALWQAREAGREAGRAVAVTRFLVGLFQVADPAYSRGREITARELLDRGVAGLDSGLAGQPSVQAELLGVLGTIHHGLGFLGRADSLLRRSIAMIRSGAGDRLTLAARLTDLGGVLENRSQYAAAESVLTEALAIRRRELGTRHADVAVTLGNLAATLHSLGKDSVAELMYRDVLRIDSVAFGPESPELAQDLSNLGVMWDDLGQPARADTALRKALAIRLARYDSTHPLVLNDLGNYAGSLMGLARFAEAERLTRRVLELRRRVFPPDHPDHGYSLHQLGVVLEQQGRWNESDSAYRAALELRRRVMGPENDLTMASLNNLAITRYRVGDYAEAASLMREVVRVWTGTLGAEHSRTLTASNNLGAILVAGSQLAEAEPLLERVIASRRRMHGDTDLNVALPLRNLGVLYRRTGRLDEGEQALREAVRIYRAVLPAGHPRLGEALTDLGRVFIEQRRFADAEAALREALAIRAAALGDDDPRTAETRTELERATRGRPIR